MDSCPLVSKLKIKTLKKKKKKIETRREGPEEAFSQDKCRDKGGKAYAP